MPAAIPLGNSSKMLSFLLYGHEYRLPNLAHPSNNMPIYYRFYVDIGQFPTSDGLFGPPYLAYFSRLSLSLTSVRSPKWSVWCHDRGYAIRWAPRAQNPGDFLRVLPAEDRGDGAQPVGDHQASGAAGAQFRLGDLWRRRIHPRAHPFHHHPHP